MRALFRNRTAWILIAITVAALISIVYLINYRHYSKEVVVSQILDSYGVIVEKDYGRYLVRIIHPDGTASQIWHYENELVFTKMTEIPETTLSKKEGN